MYDTSQTPNFLLMIFIALGTAFCIAVPLFKQSTRERIWHWGRGENSLRYSLAFLSFILSFMMGAAHLASLFPELSSCTTIYSSTTTSITRSTTTTHLGRGGSGIEAGTPEPMLEIFRNESVTTSTECVTSGVGIELWWKMMTPPFTRFVFASSTVHDMFYYKGSSFPANSQEAYIALWGTSLASAFASLYMTAYLLRDARKRKVEE
jgi:hypothetical protein